MLMTGRPERDRNTGPSRPPASRPSKARPQASTCVVARRRDAAIGRAGTNGDDMPRQAGQFARSASIIGVPRAGQHVEAPRAAGPAHHRAFEAQDIERHRRRCAAHPERDAPRARRPRSARDATAARCPRRRARSASPASSAQISDSVQPPQPPDCSQTRLSVRRSALPWHVTRHRSISFRRAGAG